MSLSRILILSTMVLAAACGGHKAIRLTENWTPEDALRTIEDFERAEYARVAHAAMVGVDPDRRYGLDTSLAAEDIRADANGMLDFYLDATERNGDTLVRRYDLRRLRFDQIESVYIDRDGGGWVLPLLTFGMAGPNLNNYVTAGLASDVAVPLGGHPDSSREASGAVIQSVYATGWENFFPMWLFSPSGRGDARRYGEAVLYMSRLAHGEIAAPAGSPAPVAADDVAEALTYLTRYQRQRLLEAFRNAELAPALAAEAQQYGLTQQVDGGTIVWTDADGAVRARIVRLDNPADAAAVEHVVRQAAEGTAPVTFCFARRAESATGVDVWRLRPEAWLEHVVRLESTP